MAVVYNVSYFGRLYVADEGFDSLPLVRLLFVVGTVILGSTVFLLVSKHYINLLRTLRTNRREKDVRKVIMLLTIIFLLSYFVHTAHYADNIVRPTDYFEPRYLYRSYVLETMEITFFVNFPISLAALYGMLTLFGSTKNQLTFSKSGIYGVYFYVGGSFLTLGHYRIEPPSSYTWDVNLTIAGEGFLTLLLLLVLIFSIHKHADRFFARCKEKNVGAEAAEEKLLSEQLTRRSPKTSKR